MKLYLRNQHEADQIKNSLRFLRWDYPDKLVLSFPESLDFDLETDSITVERTDSQPLSENGLVFASFDAASDALGDTPLLCISKTCALLYVPASPDIEESTIINRHIEESDCFVFASDSKAREFMAGRRFHTIVYPQPLFSASQKYNLLICSDYAVFQTMLYAITPDYLCFGIRGKYYNLILGLETMENIAQTLSRKLLWSAETLAISTRLSTDLRQAVILSMDKHNTAYSIFADYYDDYMAHVDYELWISRILDWQGKYSTSGCKRILEIACGTANVASRLVRKGFTVDASDISAAMLRVAAGKISRPNLYQAALTDPIPGRDYDLILCMFDSINYLLELSDISTLLRNAHEALAPQGLFIFDISTLLNSLENFSDVCSVTENDKHVLIHEARYEPHHRRQISKLNDFIRIGATYRRMIEDHVQRVYLNDELLNLIDQSPLKLIAIHSTEHKANLYPKKMQRIDTGHYRLFYILSKK
ncbi:MAG TPA: class I SAM-dependent methyltransferase [Candidatus Cloacimonadota bacterium]|nr:class I SAM-dependent methyltransferase [Candidatus Cloacimonadota bacterium]